MFILYSAFQSKVSLQLSTNKHDVETIKITIKTKKGVIFIFSYI